MNRIISVLMTYIMVILVFDAACECEVPPEEVATSDLELKAGFTKFISDIEPTMSDDYIMGRAVSKLEIINSNLEQYEVTEKQPKKKQSDVDLLATLVRAEAGNQPLDGKRAVVDVVLNRVDNSHFPNTIKGVIYQEGQFKCITDGNFARALSTKDESDYEAVRLELADRTDYDIIYFQTDYYSEYGTPAYIIGDHYFAKQ